VFSLSTKKRDQMTLEGATSSTAVTTGVGAGPGGPGPGPGPGPGALGSIVRRPSRPKKFSISKLFHRDKAGRLKLVDRPKSNFSTASSGGEWNPNGTASATVASIRSTVVSSDAFSPHQLDQVPEERGENEIRMMHPDDHDSPHAVLLHNPQLYHNDVTLSETATFRKRPRRRLRFRNSTTAGANANASLSMSWFSQLEWFKRISHWAFDVVDSDQSGQVDEQELYSGLLLIHLKLGTYAGPAACKVGFFGVSGMATHDMTKSPEATTMERFLIFDLGYSLIRFSSFSAFHIY
jgi:hypothetical protein